MTDGSQPSDRLRERAEASRTKLWLLLDADRRLVAAGILAVLLVGLVVLAASYPAASRTLRSGDPVETLFQALVTATVTGVTLVLTLNQLVLSQELGAVGDQRERMEGAMSFREDAATALEAPVSPARPSAFLRGFVQVAGERAERLRETVPDDDSEAASAVAELTDSLVGNAEQVETALEGAQFGEFDVVSAALDFNYSWKVFEVRRIRAVHGDALNETAGEALDELERVLRLFGPAREHFKTLYFQWELVDLSRSILVAAVPALLVSVAMLLFVDATAVTGQVLGLDVAVLVVCVATAAALAPFAILLSYVLRIATITKHTLSIGPFILRETERTDEVEWDR